MDLKKERKESPIVDKLVNKLESEGYQFLTIIPGKGICGLFQFAFTIGLVVGIDENGYRERYCYPNDKSHRALIALKTWMKDTPEAEEDPKDSFWIKRKSLVRKEIKNKLHPSFDPRFDS